MQIIREGPAKKKILLIFTIILCIYPLFTTSEIRIFSHDEEKDYGPTALPRVWNLKTYDDGTAVARITRKNINTSTATEDCFYEMLSLRIIHPNGTVDEKDINLDIPQFNYCVSQNGTEFFNYYLIRKNHILVTYYNYNTTDDISYEEWGMVIDFDGNVFDRTSLDQFKPPFIDETTHQVIPSKIQLNINREKGFMKFSYYKSSILWAQYEIKPNGTLVAQSSIVDSTVFEMEYETDLMIATIVSTMNEGYAIVYARLINNFDATKPYLPQAGLFILFIDNQIPGLELLLYQTTSPNLSFSALSCDISYMIFGHVCALTIKDSAGDKIFYAQVNLLSSGSYVTFDPINDMIPNDDLNIVWAVKSLLFGGYILTTNNIKDNNHFFIYNELIGFPEPVPTNINGVFQVLPHNNTLLIAQMETNNSWQFRVIDLTKFAKDKGYLNPNVVATFPAINSSIDLNMTKISIEFSDGVTLSNGNLSIYQMIDDQPYLRQFISGKECSIEHDYIVSAGVLESTFSVYKGNYFIKVDNNFVMDGDNKEPLLGIRENVWSFTTKEKNVTFSLLTTSLLRLTSKGTHEFDNSSQEQRTNFFNILLEELSFAIPINKSRLTTNRITQLDRSVNEKQYLISVTIKIEKDDNVSNVTSVIDTMIKHKDQTPIGLGLATRYLDESYGFKELPNFWKKIFVAFLTVGPLTVLFFVLFLFSRRSNRNGNNIAILQFGVIIFDLVIDILFISRNSNDIPNLHLSSVLTVTISIGINTILAFHIITKENATRPRFYHWFTAHEKITNIITILAASADIKALNILNSNLAGFTFLRAPSFSEISKSKIFWGTCLNIFIEDIPQVIIQIYYLTSVLSYEVIPLLTLTSSAVNLTINVLFVIRGLYQLFNRMYNRLNGRTVTI